MSRVEISSLSDDELLDRFLASVPAENQEDTAARVGKNRSQVSRWITARKEGKSVDLQKDTRRRMEEALRDLTVGGAETRARMEAFQMAAREAEELAARLRALAISAAPTKEEKEKLRLAAERFLHPAEEDQPKEDAG